MEPGPRTNLEGNYAAVVGWVVWCKLNLVEGGWEFEDQEGIVDGGRNGIGNEHVVRCGIGDDSVDQVG